MHWVDCLAIVPICTVVYFVWILHAGRTDNLSHGRVLISLFVLNAIIRSYTTSAVLHGCIALVPLSLVYAFFFSIFHHKK